MLESLYTLQMPANTAINISIPNNDEGHGFFPEIGNKTVNDKTHLLINGFLVDNTEVGTIKDITGDELAVTYTHIKSSENKIRFYANTGERCVIDIINVPIHDHSSIIQGGPAVGTYFTEPDEE